MLMHLDFSILVHWGVTCNMLHPLDAPSSAAPCHNVMPSDSTWHGFVLTLPVYHNCLLQHGQQMTVERQIEVVWVHGLPASFVDAALLHADRGLPWTLMAIGRMVETRWPTAVRSREFNF